MMPPPTTKSLFGISTKSNAVLDVRTDGWSAGTPGIVAETEPAATIHLLNEMAISPTSVFTLNSVLDVKVAAPFTHSTFRALAIWAIPSFSCNTILSLWARIASKSI